MRRLIVYRKKGILTKILIVYRDDRQINKKTEMSQILKEN